MLSTIHDLLAYLERLHLTTIPNFAKHLILYRFLIIVWILVSLATFYPC